MLTGCNNIWLKADCTDTFWTYRKWCDIVYSEWDYYVISWWTSTYYTWEYSVQAEWSSPWVMAVKYKEQYEITWWENLAFKVECIIKYPPKKRRKSMIKFQENQYGI